MAKTIMFQGTSSDVGKSILATAICRIFSNRNYKVSPFKAQNMALNSYVTYSGAEMGRAQVAQAEAARTIPDVSMNPVLLKPTGNMSSQVILMGQPVGVYSAREYHTKYSQNALDAIKESLNYLNKNFDLIVIEGAGSPAEINLKKNDIVNMRIAKMTNAPVILVTDIDRGGSIAAIVGTLELLDKDERDLVKGIIINKFRGDITLLKPALDFIETYTNKPILGVIPHIDKINIDEEDSVALQRKNTSTDSEIEIAVIQLPKISNFTDFDAFAYENDVKLSYIKNGEKIGNVDAIIIPGSKSTVADLEYIRNNGYDKEIMIHLSQNKPVVGICGGYQMLGVEILDPYNVESDQFSTPGLGLLPISTKMSKDKQTNQAEFIYYNENYPTNDKMTGYEIHMGQSRVLDKSMVIPLFKMINNKDASVIEGYKNLTNTVFGTYLHGVFDNDSLRRTFINKLRLNKNLTEMPIKFKYKEHKEAAYDRLAKIVEANLDMDKLIKIINGKDV